MSWILKGPVEPRQIKREPRHSSLFLEGRFQIGEVHPRKDAVIQLLDEFSDTICFDRILISVRYWPYMFMLCLFRDSHTALSSSPRTSPSGVGKSQGNPQKVV